jgi:hypothetical protein
MELTRTVLVEVVITGILLCVVADLDTSKERVKKQLGVFTVVKFPNTACNSATTGRNGTCYTASECSAKGGSSSGSCASSFGVCCIFEKTCGGGSVAENCTYFTSTGLTKGSSCSLTICKCSSAVCQLRIDFETFVLNDPVTATTITVGPAAAAAGSANRIGNCDTDSFGVTVPGGKSPPLICGVNTGQHMYVPASDQCNVLNGNIGSSSASTSSAFTMKVTQVECSSKTKAPSGCTQYFTSDTGTIETYNYNSGGGVLLANQDYSACIRAGRTYCSICYYSSSFKMSVPNGIAAIGELGVDTNCGAAGLTAPFANGGAFDHIVIPGGQCNNNVAITVLNDRYCGTAFYCLAAVPTDTQNAAATDSTVCTNQKPFKISVESDGLEYMNPDNANGEGFTGNNVGFSISYFMKTSCLTRPNA